MKGLRRETWKLLHCSRSIFFCSAFVAFPVLSHPFSVSSVDSVVNPLFGAPDTSVVTIRSFETVLAFDPDRITVKQGAVVRIRYVNESTFAHNLVIVKKDADIDVIGPHAQEAAAEGYVPKQYRDRVIAFSPLAAPGKTVEFTFTVPAAGEYPFVCFVDGHYNMMVGTLRALP